MSLLECDFEHVWGVCEECGEQIVDWRHIGYKDGKMVHSFHEGANKPDEYLNRPGWR